MANQQIVHNTGVNYSLYYNVLNYFKTIMKNHPSIQSVTYGDIDSIDDKQYPEYPLGNVLITDSRFEPSTTTFTVQLTLADKQKNRNNESTGEENSQTIPFYGVDDMVDIHANTLSILNDLTAYTQRGVQGFEVNGDIVCQPFSDRFNNGLAGWVATFELTTHNDRNRCLFFLVNPSGSGYIIEDCISGEQYKAVLNGSGSIGQVFASSYVPPQSVNITTSYGYDCYTIVDTFENENDFDLVNLPILELPYSDFGDCPTCLKWIEPQIWGTTFQNWSSGPDVTFKTWSKA
jgi:hypothetical protein